MEFFCFYHSERFTFHAGSLTDCLESYKWKRPQLMVRLSLNAIVPIHYYFGKPLPINITIFINTREKGKSRKGFIVPLLSNYNTTDQGYP